jgi:hypothetical protein
LGLRRGLLGGDLDAVGELHTLDHLWQLIVAVEAAPAFLCGLDEFEDYGERGLVREALRQTWPLGVETGTNAGGSKIKIPLLFRDFAIDNNGEQ